MNLAEQEKFFLHFTKIMYDTLMRKGSDYSDLSDRLSNFKMAGAITGLSPEQNCLSLIATKVARLGQLLAPGRTPSNESVQDSVLDMANYAVLLAMLLDDRTVDVDRPASTYKEELEQYKQELKAGLHQMGPQGELKRNW